MDLKEQKKAEISNELTKILEGIETYALENKRLDEVESGLFKSLLSLGLKLLGYYIFMVSLQVHKRGVPLDSEGNKMKNTGRRKRPYRSVFGLLSIERPKYYSSSDKVHYALDVELGLPSGKMSYLLSDWISYGAVDLDFRESVGLIEHILGQQLVGEQSSRCTYHLSGEVEAYYEEKDWSALGDLGDKEEGSHFSVGFDGKGVPILKSETDRADESVSVRLSRGQKRQVKKEATVSVSSSFTPKIRSKEEIINNLFHIKMETQLNRVVETSEELEKKHCWHEHKHTRAFLSDKEKGIKYGIENVLKRDKTGNKPIIVLIDGDRSLRKAVERIADKKAITDRISDYVLDFIHVLEYVWKVANAYKGEKNPDREKWVEQQADLLLSGQVHQIITSWKTIRDKGKNEVGKKFSANQIYNVNRGITYFSNHSDMMKYDVYLKLGYPITTGAIESACGHFVKSRMEKNAMHWSKKGAQKMLNIRAIKKNGDWKDYSKSFIQKEQKNLYKSVA